MPRSKKKRLPQSSKIEAWLNSPFFHECRKPVPQDLFVACVQVYQSAARFTMPVLNPLEKKVQIGGITYGFADIPENRGMFAVFDFAKQPEIHSALACRLMAMIAAFRSIQSDPRFSKFFTDDTEQSVMVHDSLFKAFATADFIPKTLDIDTESMLKIASRLFDEDPPDAQ